MKNKPENVMIGVFMAGAVALLGWHNYNKPSILILHSYERDYAWVRDINIGLNRVLNESYRYRVRWYYMDTKRHPFDDHKHRAGIAARDVIKTTRPDVVIAIDDDAQQYAARHFVGDARIKIVFAGVNRDAADYGYDRADNVTGVLERVPLGAVREALSSSASLQAMAQPVRVAYLGDRSESVDGDAKQTRDFDWRPLLFTGASQVDTWAEWQTSVLTLGRENDALIVSGYRRLRRSTTDPTLVPPREVVAWTETHSPVPIISLNAFYTEDGGMLAIGTSPYEQGELAALRALDIILHRRAAKQLPIVNSSQFVVSMRGQNMRTRRFVLPRVYEAAARTGDRYVP